MGLDQRLLIIQKYIQQNSVHFMTIKGLYPFSDKHIENDKLFQFR